MIISTNGHSLNGTAPNGVKAIETEYNGYRFRSRLEARWAVFFDALGVKYQYEPEGFELEGGERYLPDFWLPKEQMWVEIKPELPKGVWDGSSKAERFSRALDQKVWLAAGDPLESSSLLISGKYWWFDNNSKIKIDEIDLCALCGSLTLHKEGCWCRDAQDKEFYIGALRTWEPKIKSAARLARSARFEYGEKPSLVLDGKIGKGGRVYLAGKVEDEWRASICTMNVENLTGKGGDVCQVGETTVISHYMAHWRYGGPNIEAQHSHVSFIPKECLDLIHKCDVVFAYINSDYTHGTLVEIGYANAISKPVFLAFDTGARAYDMWFPKELANAFYVTDKPHEAWRVFENWWNRRA